EGLIDFEAELKRQRGEAEKLAGLIRGHEKKLANREFTDRAPEEVVSQIRDTLAGWQKQLESVERMVADLGRG
ncbi:MAG: hypothetical protein HQL31_12400, partial [Planctomycetes bacterium]|nr:hypothetical protein [Planctomycetota bacterium]